MKYVTSDGSILTPAEIARLDEIEAKMGDSVDIPETTSEQWATAVTGKFFKARKESISLRLDMDILDWLRRSGPRYQTRINLILREKMNAELTAPKSAL